MESDCEPLKVTFFPPLHHQRRIWILDRLRRERLTEIVDIGCGEGALLATLCQPAPWLRPSQFESADDELSSLFRDIGLNDGDTPDLHTTRIAGLDILPSQLNIAAEYTSPGSINPLYTRWEPLDVELWEGSVDVINPAFVNVQCIVASELIEHLTDDVLARVAPIVLGVYQPRVFLVTTPSYTFNPRWSPPGSTDPNGFPDPTRRTDRIFRHSDHKFEWTVDEFVWWCKCVAQQWGYTVETDAIGTPKERDPWGREDILGSATQVAHFRRLDDRYSRAMREHGTQEVCSAIKEPHKLWVKHHHEAHPRARHPSGLQEIEEAIILKFEHWRETNLGIHELWFADNLPLLCGGSVEVMLSAVEKSPKLEVQRATGQPRGNWRIQLVGGLTDRLPAQTAPVEIENVMCEDDDELDYDEAKENSFDSGIHMGMTCDDVAWRSKDMEDVDWAQISGGGDGWATNC